MGIVADIAAATAPREVDSEAWEGVQFRVREISVGEAMAAGDVTGRVLRSVVQSAQAGDTGRAVALAGQAALNWAHHHEKVASIAVIAMRSVGDEWEPVKLQFQRSNDGLPDGQLWTGVLSFADLQNIYSVAMGAASRAALSARPFRDDGQEPESGGATAGRDGEAVRDDPNGAPLGDPGGAGEE